ncbi:MAG: TIGR02996 domain-containing protein [Gemmataceae bacterium]
MSEEDAFLLEILARPDDDAPRLIYADWLADRDDPRGALVRLDWELRGPERVAFVRRRESLCRYRGWYEYAGLVLTREQFVTAFRVRLAETMAHCSGRPLSALRHWEFDPRMLTGRLNNVGWPYSDEIDWAAMVLQVAIARRRALEMAGAAPSRPAASVAGGRLLLFDPWVTISVGEAKTYSSGYFDAENLPPWDTWVVQVPEPSPVERQVPGQVTPHYLVAWVPQPYVQRAGLGVQTNHEAGLRWLGEVNTPFAEALRLAGIRP